LKTSEKGTANAPLKKKYDVPAQERARQNGDQMGGTSYGGRPLCSSKKLRAKASAQNKNRETNKRKETSNARGTYGRGGNQ